jgi:hypothetical protein
MDSIPLSDQPPQPNKHTKTTSHHKKNKIKNFCQSNERLNEHVLKRQPFRKSQSRYNLETKNTRFNLTREREGENN